MTRVLPLLGITLQFALVGGTAALALAPPAEGMMLVAPLLPVTPASTLDWVLPTGARLVAPGPYAGSFIVYGVRSVMVASALKRGTLLLTSRFSGCGTTARTVV